MIAFVSSHNPTYSGFCINRANISELCNSFLIHLFNIRYTSYTTYLVVKYTIINCGSDDTKSPDFIADTAEFISTHRIIVLACDDWWPRIFLINNFD